MKQLVRGVHRFQDEIEAQKEFYAKLAQGQSPGALFITCSDSRINPHLLTQAQPGDIFVLRNAGNIVPPYGFHAGGESATIEYAIAALDIENVIVCGHSHCGAITALLHPERTENLPAVRSWLTHAETTRRILAENYATVEDEEELINIAIQENVLAQIENLQTHPAVAAKIARGQLHLLGWVYQIETGNVFSYDQESSQFLPLSDTPAEAPAKRLLKDALFGGND